MVYLVQQYGVPGWLICDVPGIHPCLAVCDHRGGISLDGEEHWVRCVFSMDTKHGSIQQYLVSYTSKYVYDTGTKHETLNSYRLVQRSVQKNHPATSHKNLNLFHM